jgi:hypothetical protein
MSRTGGVRRPQLAAVLAAVSLVVSGCSSLQDDSTEDTAQTSPTATAEASTNTGPTETATEEPPGLASIMTVTFDGNGCLYDGPSQLPAGVVTLQFVNDSDRDAAVSMAKLKDGVTLEDVRALDLRRLDDQPADDLNGFDVYDPEQGAVSYRLGPGEENRDYSAHVVAGEWVLTCGVFRAFSDAPRWAAGGVSVTE